jgi:hypothetical protein
VNATTWTPAELAEFDRLTIDEALSAKQAAEKGRATSNFCKKHGEAKVNAMWRHITMKEAA